MTRSKTERLASRDGDKCYYCGLPMHMPNGDRNEFLKPLGISKKAFGTQSFFRHVRASKEHLHKRADGGSNNMKNLVLCHSFCNTIRGDRTPEQHKEHIKEVMKNPLSPLYILNKFFGKGAQKCTETKDMFE